MRLTDKHLACIHLMILDRFDRANQTSWLAKQVGVTPVTVATWKREPDFQAEYHRQLSIYRNNFDDIRLADRKERVRVLSDLFDQVKEAGPRATSLKMTILEQIRIEMGLGEPEKHQHLHAFLGVNTPPRANSYEEWLKQNDSMDKARPAIAQAIAETASEAA